MTWHTLDGRDWAKTIGIGVAVSILTAAFMVAGIKSGVSPLPKSLGLAFAETILRRPLPLPPVPHRLDHGVFDALCHPVPRCPHIRPRVLARSRIVAAGAGVLLSHRWLGLFRSWRQSENDCRGRRAASAIRGLPLGLVPMGLWKRKVGLIVRLCATRLYDSPAITAASTCKASVVPSDSPFSKSCPACPMVLVTCAKQRTALPRARAKV